jgi:hypothetical protein
MGREGKGRKGGGGREGRKEGRRDGGREGGRNRSLIGRNQLKELGFRTG